MSDLLQCSNLWKRTVAVICIKAANDLSRKIMGSACLRPDIVKMLEDRNPARQFTSRPHFHYGQLSQWKWVDKMITLEPLPVSANVLNRKQKIKALLHVFRFVIPTEMIWISCTIMTTVLIWRQKCFYSELKQNPDSLHNALVQRNGKHEHKIKWQHKVEDVSEASVTIHFSSAAINA